MVSGRQRARNYDILNNGFGHAGVRYFSSDVSIPDDFCRTGVVTRRSARAITRVAITYRYHLSFFIFYFLRITMRDRYSQLVGVGGLRTYVRICIFIYKGDVKKYEARNKRGERRVSRISARCESARNPKPRVLIYYVSQRVPLIHTVMVKARGLSWNV